MANETQRAESIKQLREMIKDIKVAMLTTAEADGTLRSRPMMTQQTEFDGDLWFFTAASSPKIGELQHNQQVNLSYSKPDDQRYVSVSGMAQLVHDEAKVKELWNPVYKAWFPKGPEDPDLTLLKVNVTQAEYWDSPSGTIVQLAGFVKALATGRRYEGGDDVKIHLGDA